MKTSELEQIKEVMRAVLREERGNAAAVAPVERPGGPVVFQCGCERESCQATLEVRPIKVGGEKRIHLVSSSPYPGIVLSRADRIRLFRILADLDWFGEQANADA